MTGTPVAPDRAVKHQSQWLALVVGVVYTLLGLAGFLVTLRVPFASPEGARLLGLSLNSLANLVHLAVGLTGLAAWRNLRLASSFGWLLAAVMVVLTGWGFAAAGDDPANLLALDNSINGVHAITAVYGVFIALWPATQVETEDAAPVELRGTPRSGGRD